MIYEPEYFDCRHCHGNGCDICGGTGKSSVPVDPKPANDGFTRIFSESQPELKWEPIGGNPIDFEKTPYNIMNNPKRLLKKMGKDLKDELYDIKHPLNDLYKEQKLVYDAINSAHLASPVQMEIVNGEARPVIQDLTDHERALYENLHYINEKINRFNQKVSDARKNL
jgi:hypothetical protein